MASYDDAEEELLDQLLTEHYNYLVRHINTREFIPHLISQQVLTSQDKEDIESKITGIDRAGRLIDLVKMRGYKGMCEFMLALEYDAPAAFFHVKQREARPPPSEWVLIRRNYPSVRKRRSVDSMTQLQGKIAILMSELSNQKEAVDKIMHRMNDVQELQSTTTQEQQQDWHNYESQLTEMDDKCALLSTELVQSKKSHEELKTKFEEMKKENEKLNTQHIEDRGRLTSMQRDCDAAWNEIDGLKSRKSNLRARESKDVKTLIEEIDRLTSLLQASQQKESEEEVSRLRLQLEKMAQRNAEFSADITKAQEQRDKTFKDLQTLETQLQTQTKQLVNVQEENATYKKRGEDLELNIGRLEDDNYWLERGTHRRRNIQDPPRTPQTPTSPDVEAILRRGFKGFDHTTEQSALTTPPTPTSPGQTPNPLLRNKSGS